MSTSWRVSTGTVGEIPWNCRIFGAWIQTVAKGQKSEKEFGESLQGSLICGINNIISTDSWWYHVTVISHDITRSSRSISVSEVNKQHDLEWRLRTFQSCDFYRNLGCIPGIVITMEGPHLYMEPPQLYHIIHGLLYGLCSNWYQLLHFSNSVDSCRIATILSSVLREFNHVQSRMWLAIARLSPGYLFIVKPPRKKVFK